MKIKQLIREILLEMTKGVNLEQPHSNLYIKGWGVDKNGNSRIVIGFPNDTGFPIQTNGNLPKTHRIVGVSHKGLSDDSLDIIGREITDYVTAHGSPKVKAKLKIYKQ